MGRVLRSSCKPQSSRVRGCSTNQRNDGAVPNPSPSGLQRHMYPLLQILSPLQNSTAPLTGTCTTCAVPIHPQPRTLECPMQPLLPPSICIILYSPSPYIKHLPPLRPWSPPLAPSTPLPASTPLSVPWNFTSPRMALSCAVASLNYVHPDDRLKL